MVLQGQPPSIGGSQPVSSSILRSSSGILAAEGGSVPSQSTYSSLVSPRTHLNSMMLGNGAHMSSILGQAYGNGGSSSLLTGPGSSQRGGIESGAELDPLSGVGNGVSFSGPSSSFVPSNLASPSTSGHFQGQQFPNSSSNQFMPDRSPSQQLEQQKYQHDQQSMQQFSSHQNMQQQQQQVRQQFQSVRGGLAGAGPVKLEPQTTNEQHGQQLQQPFQSIRNLAPVKLEPQQIQNIRNLPPVKMEPQHQDQSLFLSQQQQQLQLQQQQQQQQQQLLPMARQSPQAAAAAQMNLLNQQRLLQLQQQQQLLKNSIPSQRAQLPQQFQQQNLQSRSPVKSIYEPGMGARRLTRYMYQQQHRPQENNIEFWRRFVTEYFAPNAKKKWCVSLYGSGRQTTGVFPQDAWHCEICNHKPGRGFEATVEVLPRLFKIKYESGTLEELLYVDMPREYQNSSGQIVLDYAKAIQESVFEQLRVVRDGQLRIVFSPDLKICSWEFCARRHEELIPRRLLIPQVTVLGAAAQKYQSVAQNASSNLSSGELQSNCNMFLSSARQLAKALEVPLVNELGYTKRYVRCLQISEVVNCMKDLIDYSRETGTGPMESLAKFPRRTGASSGIRSQAQSSEEQQQQQQTAENACTDQGSTQSAAMQVAAGSNMGTVNNTLNVASTSTSSSTIVGLLHQNSFNARQQNSTSNVGSPYGNNGVHISSPSSSNTVPPQHPSSSNPSNSHGALSVSSHMNSISSPLNMPLQQSTLINENDLNDSRSSVQKILQEIVMSGHGSGSGAMVGVGSLGNDLKHVNGSLPSNANNGLSGANSLSGNGTINNSNIGGAGYGTLGSQLGHTVTVNGFRTVIGNSPMMNGRGAMTSLRDQSMNSQDLNNQHQLLSGLGSTNGFGNMQYDWKPSP